MCLLVKLGKTMSKCINSAAYLIKTYYCKIFSIVGFLFAFPLSVYPNEWTLGPCYLQYLQPCSRDSAIQFFLFRFTLLYLNFWLINQFVGLYFIDTLAAIWKCVEWFFFNLKCVPYYIWLKEALSCSKMLPKIFPRNTFQL